MVFVFVFLFKFRSYWSFSITNYSHQYFHSDEKLYSNQKLGSRNRRCLFDFILTCTRHQQIFKRFRLILCVEFSDKIAEIDRTYGDMDISIGGVLEIWVFFFCRHAVCVIFTSRNDFIEVIDLLVVDLICLFLKPPHTHTIVTP